MELLTEEKAPLEVALGSYLGEGVWHDSANVSHRYLVEMRIEKMINGNIRQWYKHTFFEEQNQPKPQPDIEGTIEFAFRQNGIFDVILIGAPFKGRGYCSTEFCHHAIPIPNNQVEVTQLFDAAGTIKTIGSAEKNIQGNYIWWEEKVSRK